MRDYFIVLDTVDSYLYYYVRGVSDFLIHSCSLGKHYKDTIQSKVMTERELKGEINR